MSSPFLPNWRLRWYEIVLLGVALGSIVIAVTWASKPIEWVTLMVAVLVLAVYCGQMRAMESQLEEMGKQLEISRNSATFDHVITLLGFLQDSDTRKARTRVIRELNGVNHLNWSAQDNKDAATVCSSYSAVGFVLNELMTEEPQVINVFTAGWSHSILACDEILKPYLASLREKAGPDYWLGFDWLQEMAEKNRKSEGS